MAICEVDMYTREKNRSVRLGLERNLGCLVNMHSTFQDHLSQSLHVSPTFLNTLVICHPTSVPGIYGFSLMRFLMYCLRRVCSTIDIGSCSLTKIAGHHCRLSLYQRGSFEQRAEKNSLFRHCDHRHHFNMQPLDEA